MAVDSRLALGAQGVDVGASFGNALLNVQRAQQLQQQRKQAELNEQLQPLRNRLLETQVTTAEQGVLTPEQLAQQRASSSQEAMINNLGSVSQQALAAIELGGAGASSAVLERAIGQFAGTPSEPELLEMLQMSRDDPEKFKQGLQSMVTMQQRLKAGAPSAGQREFESLISGFTPEQQQQARLTKARIVAPAGTSAQERIAASPATTSAVAQSQGEIAGSVAQSKADVEIATAPKVAGGKAAADQAVKLSGDAFKRLEGISSNIANFDEAIRLIDEGAETGVIASRLPSFKKASLELDALQNRLGLDVVGNTTFGALSESELKFALDTALPKNLQPQDLKRWIQRKKESMQKLSRYVGSVATFLGTPGNTVADFIELQKLKQLDSESPQATTQPQQIGRFTIEVE